MQDQAALLGANAVVGVDLDYETVGDSGSYADGNRKRHSCQNRRLR